MNTGGVSFIRRRDTSLIFTGGKKDRVGMEASKFVVGGSKSLLRL